MAESKAVQELRKEILSWCPSIPDSRLMRKAEVVFAELEEAQRQFTASQVGEALQQVVLLKKQLATVTEDRDKWEAVAKANQDEIDRFQKSFECAIDLCVTESDMPRKWARAIRKEHQEVLEALKGKHAY